MELGIEEQSFHKKQYKQKFDVPFMGLELRG